MPSISNSLSAQPAPMPNSSRPSESWSTVVAILASTAGCRYGLPVTRQPIRTRLVASAIAASRLQPSNTGPAGSPRMAAKWSKPQIWSKPASSPTCQTARRCSTVVFIGISRMPTLTCSLMSIIVRDRAMTTPIPCLPVNYLEANAERAPDSPAVIDPARTLTFAELAATVRLTAANLFAEGLRPEQVAAVQLPNVWQHVALELAIPHLGAIVMPLPLTLGQAELSETLRTSGASMLVTGSGPEHDAARAVASKTGIAVLDGATVCERDAAGLPT